MFKICEDVQLVKSALLGGPSNYDFLLPGVQTAASSGPAACVPTVDVQNSLQSRVLRSCHDPSSDHQMPDTRLYRMLCVMIDCAACTPHKPTTDPVFGKDKDPKQEHFSGLRRGGGGFQIQNQPYGFGQPDFSAHTKLLSVFGIPFNKSNPILVLRQEADLSGEEAASYDGRKFPLFLLHYIRITGISKIGIILSRGIIYFEFEEEEKEGRERKLGYQMQKGEVNKEEGGWARLMVDGQRIKGESRMERGRAMAATIFDEDRMAGSCKPRSGAPAARY
ncbi:hypothetical protein CVT26_008030 [Gymnopilus dilepis]|uniref:Uncharacterized protein n=1 Tax=Gymnopilus dilepis TaxID=231916 RepID=A0A409YJI5_9AGAR|nr:hypothetical protein CVT26_008030 [Gymnopilus dilepis]